MRAVAFAVVVSAAVGTSASAEAQAQSAPEEAVTYAQALSRARVVAPDLTVARSRENVARAEVGIAGTYSNPTFIAGTSTQAAPLSLGASVPLVIFGQRGASIRASEADLATVRVDTQVTWNDVRSQVARAYVALWSAQKVAAARLDAAVLARRIEAAVVGRVQVGSAPEMDGLRVRAERLRADADAEEAEQLVSAAAVDLAKYIGAARADALRAASDPDTPAAPPPLGDLIARVGGNPNVRREHADARAAEARAQRERALVRPNLALDVGVDIGDPTYAGQQNYRAQLAIDVPIFNQRGAYIEREEAAAATARSRAGAEQVRAFAALEVAYRTFIASSGRMRALETGVLPAAEAAARATEESYTLGRAPLIAVIEAERTRLDARVSLVDAQTSRANAWIDVERAMGTP